MRADESWQIKTKQFYIAPTIPYKGPHTLVIEQDSAKLSGHSLALSCRPYPDNSGLVRFLTI